MRLALGGIIVATAVVLGVAWAVLSERVCLPIAGCASVVQSAVSPSLAPSKVVAALGRLEPPDGIIRIAGPSDLAVVVAQVFVKENDFVHAGQELARIDTFTMRRAVVEMREAQLHEIQARRRRATVLFENRWISEETRDARDAEEAVAAANLQVAKAQLELSTPRSPIDGQVLRIYSHAGERVGPDGIMSLARTQDMRAIAEVYETDVQHVHLDDRAVITSYAFPGTLTGTVVKIRSEVAKQALLATDPIARTDARVVEVEIKLDEPQKVQSLSNLRIDVLFKR